MVLHWLTPRSFLRLHSKRWLLHLSFSRSSSLSSVRGSVEEALAGFLPATGGAPLVPVLDAVHLTALLRLATDPPCGPVAALGRGADRVWSDGGTVLLQPLFSHTDWPHTERRTLSWVEGWGRCGTMTGVGDRDRWSLHLDWNLVGVLRVDLPEEVRGGGGRLAELRAHFCGGVSSSSWSYASGRGAGGGGRPWGAGGRDP